MVNFWPPPNGSKIPCIVWILIGLGLRVQKVSEPETWAPANREIQDAGFRSVRREH